jgi:hypothetical protein
MTDLTDMTSLDLVNAVSTYRATLAAAYADVAAIHTDAKGTAAIFAVGRQVDQLYDLACEAAARAAKGQEVTEAMVKRAAKVIAKSAGIDAPKLPADCWMGLARAAVTAALNGEEG